MSDLSIAAPDGLADHGQPSPTRALASRATGALSPRIFCGLVRLAEGALVAATGFATAALYLTEADVASGMHYAVLPVLGAIAATLIWQILGAYSIAALSGVIARSPRLLLGWLCTMALVVAALFFGKMGASVSRVWLALWALAGFASILALRVAVQDMTRRALAAGRFARRAVVYGSSAHAEAVLAALKRDAASDVRICGVFDDRGGARGAASVAGYPNRGGSSDLVRFCRDNRVDMVLIALPLSADDRIAELKRHINVLPADIRIAASSSPLTFSKQTYSYIGRVPMIDISNRPISDWGLLAKAVFDKVVAVLALLLLAPVMAAVALAVRLESKGPVLFRQKRYGFNNELIEVFKFRSMYTDRCDAEATKLVTKHDPRVTRVGRIIRKTSLDELPQLFNVLTGKLSLVGPRPHAVQASAAGQLYGDVVRGYFARHKVKPGITGWAQVNGWRGETDTEEKIQKRVEYDLQYIENWSLWFDVEILLRTPGSLLANRENAY